MKIQMLGTAGIQAFEGRQIDVETVMRFGIYTGSRADDGEVHPDPDGKIVVFPFVERDRIVGEKYRAPGKKFWQRKGGKRVLWNVDVLDDVALEEGRYPLIITEGEIDALTAIDCGFPFTVSVPDGAPAPREDEGEPEEPNPEDEAKGKFEFLWNSRDRLRRVKRFILAVDNDPAGQRLASELVRRLSPSRCLFVTYPEGCKDLNDVRMQHGPEAVTAVLNAAKPYPVKGLYTLSEYPESGPPQTFGTGWLTMDSNLKPWLGEFMVVTGIPSHGKSTWTLNLLANLSKKHGLKHAVASFEMPVKPFLRDKLRRIYLRRALDGVHSDFIEEADAWIEKNWCFLDFDPHGDGDEDLTLEWVIERATDAVWRYGINTLLIDPWNEVEHARDAREAVTDYIGRAIRSLKRFARRYEVMVIVVAHPTKEVGKDGKARPVTLYDIEGSAHWYNKADHGIVIDCPDQALRQTTVQIKKCRFEGTGSKGEVTLSFDPASGRYDSIWPTGG